MKIFCISGNKMKLASLRDNLSSCQATLPFIIPSPFKYKSHENRKILIKGKWNGFKKNLPFFNMVSLRDYFKKKRIFFLPPLTNFLYCFMVWAFTRTMEFYVLGSKHKLIYLKHF